LEDFPHFAYPQWNGTVLVLQLGLYRWQKARRIGTSSSLGQLFNHGINCCVNLDGHSTVQAFLLISKKALFDGRLQFIFFATQWKECHNGTLVHAQGKWLGVTEVSFFLSCLS
jgi:hypothetical protein